MKAKAKTSKAKAPSKAKSNRSWGRAERSALPPKARDWKEGQWQIGLFICDSNGAIMELVTHKAGGETVMLASALADAIMIDLRKSKSGEGGEKNYRVSMMGKGGALTCGYGTTLEEAKDSALKFFHAAYRRAPTDHEKHAAILEQAVKGARPEDGQYVVLPGSNWFDANGSTPA